MDENSAKKEVLIACEELVKLGLVARTWGNISCRIDEKRFAITPSGIGYDRLTPDTIAVIDIDTLKYDGKIKPSSEKKIHAAAYKLNSQINFVIHTHQTYASCLSVAGFSNLQLSPEEKTEMGGEIMLASYGLPGTGKLKKNVSDALKKGNFAAGGCGVVLMEKHGALVTGKDRETAFRRSDLLEKVCMRSVSPLIFSDSCYDGISIYQGSGKLSYEADGNKKEYSINDSDLPLPLKIHSSLLRANPSAKVLIHRNSETCGAVLKTEKEMPAILDDFAQMAGSGAMCLSSDNTAQVVNAMKKSNAVLVKGLGAVCYAEDESDTGALLTLTEKNALTFLNATRYGKPPALSLLDRKLMRFVYQNKYSKKKSEKKQPELTTKDNVIQAVKFTIFSCSAGAIQIASFTALNELTKLPYWPCYLTALILSVLYNFTVNRRFTFKSAANVPIAMMKVTGYYLLFTPLSTWLGSAAEASGINEYIVLAVTMLSNLITEFLFCRFVVYRGAINTNKAALMAAEKKSNADASFAESK